MAADNLSFDQRNSSLYSAPGSHRTVYFLRLLNRPVLRLLDFMKRHYLYALIVSRSTRLYALPKMAREIARQVLPSVVVVTTYDGTGHSLALASGFFVTANIIATNFHVIEGASDAAIKVVGESKLHRVTGVVAVSKERDLVLLQVSDVRGTPLALSTTPRK